MPKDVYYQFGETSFKNFVWLKGGGAFKNPRDLEVEMFNPGGFAVEVWDSAGYLAGKSERGNPHGGWSTFYFGPSGGFPQIANGYYTIRFVNLSGGTRNARAGSLHMVEYYPWEEIVRQVADTVGSLVRRVWK